MNYRTQAHREPSPPREEIVDLSRFSRAYVRGLLIATIVSLVAAITTFGSTDIVCDRSNKEASPACELVVSRIAFPTHEELQAGPTAVEVKDAALGDDGEKPHLAVHTLHASLPATPRLASNASRSRAMVATRTSTAWSSTLGRSSSCSARPPPRWRPPRRGA